MGKSACHSGEFICMKQVRRRQKQLFIKKKHKQQSIFNNFILTLQYKECKSQGGSSAPIETRLKRNCYNNQKNYG